MKRIVGIIVGVMMVLLIIGNSSWARVERWHLNLGIGYGSYFLSIEKANQFINQFNHWSREVLGANLKLEEIKDNPSLYSIDWRLDLSPRWRLGVSLDYLPVADNSSYLLVDTNLPSDQRKWMEVEGEVNSLMAMGGISLYRNFNPTKRLTLFAGAGARYYYLYLKGELRVWEETFLPPWDYETRDLSQSFEISDERIGYLVSVGGNWRMIKWHFDIDVSFQASYHFAPKVEGEVKEAESLGFASSPIPSQQFEIDLRGWSWKGWVAIRF